MFNLMYRLRLKLVTVKALFIIGLLVLFTHGVSATTAPQLVIIIDDIGHSLPLGHRAAMLPGPINIAVLPHQKNSITLAELAYQQGQDILLHAPMSNTQGRDPGKGTLTANMAKDEFIRTLKNNLQAIPHVQGVNNHMGSLLTQLPEPMSWVMETLRQQQLYFVDSRTSPSTIAQVKAKAYQLPNLKRDVFLDNNRDENAIHHQLELLLSIADRQGIAVAIGHPYPETLSVLEQVLPGLALRGYQLTTISQLLAPPTPKCQPELDYRQLFEPACQIQIAVKKPTNHKASIY